MMHSGMIAAISVCLLLMTANISSAAIQTRTLEYKAGDLNCKGYLAWDDSMPATEKRPGVLIIHEWWGLSDYPKGRSQQLAKLGYIAFCADMYGDGKSTSDPKQATAMMQRAVKDPNRLIAIFQAGLDQLKKQPNVDPQRLAAMGYCFGGGVCLNAARSGVDLKGVVSFHGSLDPAKAPAQKGAVKAKVLVCHGADDTFESPESIAKFQQEMTDAGVDWEMNIYAHAVHAFTNPDAGKFGIPGIGYNADADHRSWNAMAAFFKEIFSRG